MNDLEKKYLQGFLDGLNLESFNFLQNEISNRKKLMDELIDESIDYSIAHLISNHKLTLREINTKRRNLHMKSKLNKR